MKNPGPGTLLSLQEVIDLKVNNPNQYWAIGTAFKHLPLVAREAILKEAPHYSVFSGPMTLLEKYMRLIVNCESITYAHLLENLGQDDGVVAADPRDYVDAPSFTAAEKAELMCLSERLNAELLLRDQKLWTKRGDQ